MTYTPLISEIIFWVTNENSVHKGQGYDSGCLVSYLNFINISLNSVYMFALRYSH